MLVFPLPIRVGWRPPGLHWQHNLRAMATNGWLPAWSVWWGIDGLAELLPDTAARERFAADCPRLPLAMFEEFQPSIPDWPNAPCGYLRLSEAYQGPADRAKALGWTQVELDTHHLGILTDPELVVGPLVELVHQLQQPAPGSAR